MDPRRSLVRVAIVTALVTWFASASATMEAPLAIVLVQAQSEPGTSDSVWIDVAFPVTGSPDQRRSAMGVVGMHLASGETIVYRAVDGIATFDGQMLAGAIVELERVDDGPLSGDTATLVVRPDPDTADCLIYDIVGPNVHLSGEAIGRFAVHLIAPRG
jgi:hypothetical protein